MNVHRPSAHTSEPGPETGGGRRSEKREQTRTPKVFFDGTHRSVPPEKTWQRIEPLLGSFGITRLADLTGLDRIGLPVAAAIRPLSRSVVVSAGKGVTLIAAKVSAAMEAIECAHAESPSLPLFYGSRRELAYGATMPEFHRLPLARGSRVTDDCRIMWTEGRSLSSDRRYLVPYELVHAHYVRHGLPGAGHFLATTNGLSSGNTLAEATAHGVFEVAERDALAKWSRLDRARKGHRLVHLPARADCYLTDALERMQQAGFRVGLWDITSDLNIPAYHCLLLDERDPNGHPGTGSGCHPDWRVAAFRALSEAAQVRAIYISGGRDDLRRQEYDASHMASFQELLPAVAPPAPARLPPAESSHDSCEEDLASAGDALARLGRGPIIVVDLSRAGSVIAVVRVVIPGLEGPLP